MARYRLVVFTDAKEGQEDEYNEWYNNQHLRDIVALPGYVSAQRFRLHKPMQGQFPNKYLAIYTMDTDNVDKTIEHMLSLGGTKAMPISEALNATTATVAVFEVCSEEVAAG
jgi:hypothetical protein